MNDQGEMFGFERLMELVKGARIGSADALLTELLTKVNEFTADAEQHDEHEHRVADRGADGDQEDGA